MINVYNVLKACGIERAVKRTVHQHQSGHDIYLVGELGNGQWFYAERNVVEPSFSVVFVDGRDQAIARAPAAVRRVWT